MLPKYERVDQEEVGVSNHFPSSSRAGRSRFFKSPFDLAKTVFAVLGVALLLNQIISSSSYAKGPSTPESGNGAIDTQQLQQTGASIDDLFTHTLHPPTSTPENTTKALIVAATSHENISWIHEHFPDWQINVYIVDDQRAEFTLLKNRGREASVYLTYILQHYYALPDYMVFLHANRYQWHNDDPMYDGVNPVKNLRLDYVKEVGYASLRCTWSPGCPNGIHPNLTADEGFFGLRTTYARKFLDFFPDEPLPTQVSTTCCAQFAITRETAMLRRPVELERIREWLFDPGMDDQKSGRVLEYMWHVLMGKPAVLCPGAQGCFCKTFGYCDLSCPGEGRCEGRWVAPPIGSEMPVGWPLEGQGVKGYPKYGWWQKFYPGETWGLEYADVRKAVPRRR